MNLIMILCWGCLRPQTAVYAFSCWSSHQVLIKELTFFHACIVRNFLLDCYFIILKYITTVDFSLTFFIIERWNQEQNINCESLKLIYCNRFVAASWHFWNGINFIDLWGIKFDVIIMRWRKCTDEIFGI